MRKQFIAKIMSIAILFTSVLSSPVMAAEEFDYGSSTNFNFSESENKTSERGVTVSVDTTINAFQRYTVVFYDDQIFDGEVKVNGGNQVVVPSYTEQTVFTNEKILYPDDPNTAGVYEIEGWYTVSQDLHEKAYGITAELADFRINFDENGESEHMIQEYLPEGSTTLVLYPNYKYKRYTISFNMDGGRAIENQLKINGEKIDNPIKLESNGKTNDNNNPFKRGWRIKHFIDEQTGQIWDFENTSLTGVNLRNHRLKPVYEAKMYGLHIDVSNNKTFSDVRQVQEDHSFGKLPIISEETDLVNKKKPVFDGWYRSDSTGEAKREKVSGSTAITEETWLIPNFNYLTYKGIVTVHTNGVEGDYEYCVTEESLIGDIPAPTKTIDADQKVYYTFNGWYDGAGVSANKFGKGTRFFDGDTLLYPEIWAHYDEITFEKSVEILDDNGVSQNAPIIKPADRKTRVKDLPIPKGKENWDRGEKEVFEEWTDEEGNTVSGDTIVTSGMVLVPKFRVIPCVKATTKVMSGNEILDEQRHLLEIQEDDEGRRVGPVYSDIPIPKKLPDRINKIKYTFKSWMIQTGSSLTDIPLYNVIDSDEVTLVAAFESAHYDILVNIKTLSSNGNEYIDLDPYTGKTGDIVADIPKPTKEADETHLYRFRFWSMEANPDQSISETTDLVDEMTLIANFANRATGTVTITESGNSTTIPYEELNDDDYTVEDLINTLEAHGLLTHDPVADESDHTRWVFIGFTDKNGNPITDDTIITDDMLPLKQVWTKVPYDYIVDFDITDSQDIPRQYITSKEHARIFDHTLNGNGLIERPKDPVSTRRRFVRWDYKGQPWDFTDEVYENMVMDPVFIVKIKHKVTIDYLNGKKIVWDYYEGSNVEKPQDPTPPYSTEKFLYWYVQGESDTTPWNYETDTVQKQITLVPKYAKFLVKSMGDDNTVFAFVSDTDNHLKYVYLKKAGKQFVGWFKDPELTDEWNFNEDTTAHDMVLYPKYREAIVRRKVYGVLSDPIAMTPEFKVPDQGTVKASNGYKFIGWSAEEEEELWVFPERIVDEDLILIPRFTSNSLWSDVVNFGGDDGTFVDDKEFAFGDLSGQAEIVGDLPIPTKAPDEIRHIRYEFDSWVDKDGNPIDLSTTLKNGLKIYAKWKEFPYDYNVIYFAEDIRHVYTAYKGDTFDKVPKPKYYLDTKNRIKYSFKNWQTMTGEDIPFESQITEDCQINPIYGNETYKYTVTIKEAIDSEKEILYPVSDNATIADIPVPTKYGDAKRNILYTFDHWTIVNNNRVTDIAMDYVIVSDITLIPVYDGTEYINKVTFVVEGDMKKYNPQYLHYGEVATEPSNNPSKTSYSFLGWYYDGKIWDFDSMVTDNMTLNAGFVRTCKYITKAGTEDGSTMEGGTVYLVKGQKSRAIKDTTWSIDNKKIASISTYGSVKGKNVGETFVTRVGEKNATYRINVLAKKDSATTPIVSGNRITIKVGQNYNIVERESWTTSDKTVATINKNNGTITAKKAGTATVMEETSGAKYNIVVLEPSLSEKSVTLGVGDSVELSVKDSKELQVSWRSSNVKVAKVADGMVIGIGKGKANIMAYVNGKKYQCKAVVTDTPTNIAYVGSVLTTTINVGQTITMKSSAKQKATFDAAKATWAVKTSTSADTIIIKKNKFTGGVPGTATVVGTFNGKEKTVKINVKALAQKSDIYLNVGSKQNISFYKVKNAKATWSVADETIASVNKNGQVKGLKAGNTVVACNYNGAVFKTNVHVETPTLSENGGLSLIKTGQYAITLSANQKYVIDAPDVMQNIEWKASKRTVADVDDIGVIKAYREGKSIITGKVNNKTVKIHVTVKGFCPQTKHIHNYNSVIRVLVPATQEHDGKIAHICSCGIYYIETVDKLAQ